jgi:hypothetical protein
MGSAVLVLVVLAVAAWLVIIAVARVKVALSVIRERLFLLWIALAVVVGLSLAARR